MADAPANSLIYLYGIASAREGLAAPPPVAGVEPPAALQWFPVGGLSALISRVPTEHYDEVPLARHLEDPAWLAERAERHHEVLRALLDRATLLPCRFGALFRNEERLRRLVEEKYLDFHHALKRLKNRVEWSVKGFIGPPAKAPVEEEQEPAQNPGTAYLAQRLRQRQGQRQARQTAQEAAETAASEIADYAEQWMALPLSGSGRPDYCFNLACLLARDQVPPFQAMLGRLAASVEAQGLRLQSSGPWPPYNFIEIPSQS